MCSGYSSKKEKKRCVIDVKIGKDSKPKTLLLLERPKIKDATDLSAYQFKVKVTSGKVVSSLAVTVNYSSTDGLGNVHNHTYIGYDSILSDKEVGSGEDGSGLQIKKGKHGQWLFIREAAAYWTCYGDDDFDTKDCSLDKFIIQELQKTGATVYLRTPAAANDWSDGTGIETGYRPGLPNLNYRGDWTATPAIQNEQAPASNEVKVKIPKLKKGPAVKVNVTDKKIAEGEGATIKFAKNVEWRFPNSKANEDLED